jgi:hypothetical protein
MTGARNEGTPENMNNHRHLSSEEILNRVAEDPAIEAGKLTDLEGCASCAAEARSMSRFLSGLRRVDTELVATTEWDDLLLRRRIREALAKEKPHVRSIFDRFAILRPAFVSAVAAVVAIAIWTPFSGGLGEKVQLASADPNPSNRLPAWSPLPEESDDEGFAVLAEWTPNEDELAIARCRAACLAGLSMHEEEKLLSAVATTASLVPTTGASPL